MLEKIKFDVNVSGESVALYEFFENVATSHFKRTLKVSTFRNWYQMYCKYFRYFQAGNIALFKDYLQNLKSRCGKPAFSVYIHHILSGVFQVFDLALEREVVKEKYARKVKKMKVRAKREIISWTIEELITFFI
ncbi:hypothetical protein GIX45_22740 [Erwinia sp. CPCC 100877]|nr:hypothetical protein [Erwinia sp. CPCC 100877]